jgi:hypothetical protein
MGQTGMKKGIAAAMPFPVLRRSLEAGALD